MKLEGLRFPEESAVPRESHPRVPPSHVCVQVKFGEHEYPGGSFKKKKEKKRRRDKSSMGRLSQR